MIAGDTVGRVVDEHLSKARTILGTGQTPRFDAPAPPGQAPVAPATWSGEAANYAADSSAQLEQARGQIRDVQQRVSDVAIENSENARTAQMKVSAIEAAWQSDAASLRPFTGTAEGDAALLAAGQLRISEATGIVESAATDHQQAAQQIRAAAQGLPHSDAGEAHVPYEPPPPPVHPGSSWPCWIGTADGDVAALCPSGTDLVEYVDDAGNLVSKDLKTGEITVIWEPGSDPSDPRRCWLPSAGADRAICGPTTVWTTYPHEGHLITEELQPDGEIRIIFQTPLGPLIP